MRLLAYFEARRHHNGDIPDTEIIKKPDQHRAFPSENQVIAMRLRARDSIMPASAVTERRAVRGHGTIDSKRYLPIQTWLNVLTHNASFPSDRNRF